MIRPTIRDFALWLAPWRDRPSKSFHIAIGLLGDSMAEATRLIVRMVCLADGIPSDGIPSLERNSNLPNAPSLSYPEAVARLRSRFSLHARSGTHSVLLEEIGRILPDSISWSLNAPNTTDIRVFVNVAASDLTLPQWGEVEWNSFVWSVSDEAAPYWDDCSRAILHWANHAARQKWLGFEPTT